MKRVVIAVGMQFGDEGKGSIVDFLCRDLSADLVVRYSGGAQASHRVVLPDGRAHCFSQWGSGTFAGASTHLGSDVIVAPTAMQAEVDHLKELGVSDPYELLTVHPACIVATPTHRAANRALEMRRGTGRHGSCGLGIGEARRLSRRGGTIPNENPATSWYVPENLSIRVYDLCNPGKNDIEDKLRLLRSYYFWSTSGSLDLTSDTDVQLMSVSKEAEWLIEAARPFRMSINMPDFETAIFEGAQGVLLDENHGFHPYTTWSTVTHRPAFDMLLEEGHITADVRTCGVVRAYTTRHGAGPLPSETTPPFESPVDEGNPRNDWQGAMRFGALDLRLLDYALRVCPVDGLAINCIDQLSANEGGRVRVIGHTEKPEIIPYGNPMQMESMTRALFQAPPPQCKEMEFDALLDTLLLHLSVVPWILGYGPSYLGKRKTNRFPF